MYVYVDNQWNLWIIHEKSMDILEVGGGGVVWVTVFRLFFDMLTFRKRTYKTQLWAFEAL